MQSLRNPAVSCCLKNGVVWEWWWSCVCSADCIFGGGGSEKGGEGRICSHCAVERWPYREALCGELSHPTMFNAPCSDPTHQHPHPSQRFQTPWIVQYVAFNVVWQVSVVTKWLSFGRGSWFVSKAERKGFVPARRGRIKTCKPFLANPFLMYSGCSPPEDPGSF